MTEVGETLQMSTEWKRLDSDIRGNESGDDLNGKHPILHIGSVSEIDSEGATKRLDSTARRLTQLIRIPSKIAILLACCLIIVPMIGFSAVVLFFVFAYRMEKATCPYPELCPSLNTTKSEYYYVDVPAARLVFVASWSSSISLVLVNILMTMFSYHVSQQITTATQHAQLPTPYQVTLLLKTLNGELWTLVDFLLYKFKDIRFTDLSFRRHNRPRSKVSIPPVLSKSIRIFSIGIGLSIAIQIADTWLHLSTTTAPLIKVERDLGSAHQYGRLLQPIGFDDTTTIFNNSKWPMCDQHLWGQSIDCSSSNWNFRNRSLVFEIRTGTSSHSNLLNFTDDKGIRYAILGPSGTNDGTDWTATSFGVSTGQCRALPQDGCNSTFLSDQNKEQFNCTQDSAGMDLAGSFDMEIFHLHYLDFHSAVTDVQPFSTLYSGEQNVWFDYKQNPVSVPTSNDTVFRNPWRWVTAFQLLFENPFRESQSPYIWKMSADDWTEESFVMVSCETTIWDITYDFVDGRVRNISTTPSNSLATGTANMPSIGFFDHSYTYLNTYFEINAVQTSLDDLIATTAFSFSKDFASVLGAQTIPSPAVKAQSRTTQLVSQIPKSALWTLIFANLVYALFGIGVAVRALGALSEEVEQLNVRFGVAGLVAGLFGGGEAKGAVERETELFCENRGDGVVGKRVGARRTSGGGTELVIYD